VDNTSLFNELTSYFTFKMEGKISTTVIGTMPKPDYLNIPGWVKDGKQLPDVEDSLQSVFERDSDEIREQLKRATQEVISLQNNVGLSIVTDGELNRDSYINGFCRNFNGFDFSRQKRSWYRNGAREELLPIIVSRITHKSNAGFMAEEWKSSQGMSNAPVKATIPGPITIMDTFCNDFYLNEVDLLKDLSNCINIELKKLAEAGCKYVQIDDPVLVRYPDKALQYGIDYLSQCFAGVPHDVLKTVHICCGYPLYLDQVDYNKADKDAYLRLASKLDEAGFDALSIEDAHRRNHPDLFKSFKKLTIVLGVLDVVRSRIESVEEIRDHIRDVLQYIPKERLMVAPDCGLIFLPIDIAEKKLRNMVEAANSFS